MCTQHKNIWLLALLSGLLMSLPWLVPGTGLVALFAFVPLLFADSLAQECGMRRFRYVHYSSFVLWNALTTWWVWNATAGGAIFAILANALQMSLVFGLFRLSRKLFDRQRAAGGRIAAASEALPYIFLVTAWIAWERWYLVHAQISWPWLVLGNAFARTTQLAQWYEYTGSLGGSLWIWACNIGLFALLKAYICGWKASEKGSFLSRNRKWIASAAVALLVLLPIAVSAHLYQSWKPGEESIDALIVQPNIDPYHKFRAMSQKQQDAILLSQADSALTELSGAHMDSTATSECCSAMNFGSEGLLIVAPETFTNDVILPSVENGASFRSYKSFLASWPGANLLFGASSYEFYEGYNPPSLLWRELDRQFWRLGHNSAIVMDASGRYDLYHKSKLVVGVEATPYPKLFVPIDNMLGGVMGRLSGQGKADVLHYRGGVYEADEVAVRTVPFGCAVCYESVYGEFCTDYVRRGARFMTVITNDAWWGDTPGYKQHLAYSALRAIELRRDLARCGNTGISAFINSRGDIVSHTDWWKRETLSGEIHLDSRQTLFVRLGDAVGRICSFIFLLLAALLLFSFSHCSKKGRD